MNRIRLFYDEDPEKEWSRLQWARAQYVIALRVIRENLPPPPARVADIGGGDMGEDYLAKDRRLNRLAGAPVRSFSRVKRQIKHPLRYNGVRL